MKYITHRKFKEKSMVGEVNIPAGTECESYRNVIFCGDNPVCLITSENAHQYFARDDDGEGILRGRLTQAIMKELETHDDLHQSRWDKIWDDEVCQAYKRSDHQDHWLWNHDFFNAEIGVLQHIASLIGVKEV